MELVKKDTFKGKKISDFTLYKEFIMEVFKKNISARIKEGIEVSNNFFGGIEQRFENRKFNCLKTVKSDHHLKWLGKQTATVAWDMVRCLYDIVNLPTSMLMKGVLNLSGHTPTAAGPWRDISERSLMRQSGELVADVGAVLWDGLVFMKCSIVSTIKLLGYVGNGVETLLHYCSDSESAEPTVRSGNSVLQKSSVDHRNANLLAHDMSNALKEQGNRRATSVPGEAIMGDSSSNIMDKDNLQALRTVGS